MAEKYGIGQPFERLTITRKISRNLRECLCKCGTVTQVTIQNLSSKNTRSCGCLLRESRETTPLKHGYARRKKKTRTYTIWIGMRNRCLNEQEPAWQRYGGRGITIVAAWDDFKVFQADMGEAPEGLTLERIDNDGPYAPWNCRWETDAQQTRNKRSNVWLTYNSKTQVVADWARETGIQRQTILWRISAGWDVERTLTQLPRTPKQRRRHVVSAL